MATASRSTLSGTCMNTDAGGGVGDNDDELSVRSAAVACAFTLALALVANVGGGAVR